MRNAPEIADDPGGRAEVAKCSVALIGLPDDTGVRLNHGRAGAASGPAAFRQALAKYGVASPADEPTDTPAYPRVFDVGDVIIGADLHQTHDHVRAAVLSVIALGLFPIGIGGGHDLTLPFVEAVSAKRGRMNGVYFDAHLDVRPEVGSGMAFRSLFEHGCVSSLRVIGLNPLVNSREHAEYFTGKGGRITLADEVVAADVQRELAQQRGPAFCSLDMDVFDASYAPGVSALNPAGLTPGCVGSMLGGLASSGALACFDIMELCPPHDHEGRTARLAAHMFLTFLRALNAEKRS